ANCWPAGRFMTVRVTGCGGEGFRFQTTPPLTTTPRSNAPRLKISVRRLIAPTPPVRTAAFEETWEPPSAIHFNSSPTSLAACHLFSDSLARHFFTTRSSAGGVIGWREDIGGGSGSRIF